MTKLGAYLTTLTCAVALTLTGCGSSDSDDTAPTASQRTANADAGPTTVASPAEASPADEGGTDDKPSEGEGEGEATFVDGVLTTPELKIVITEHTVIPAGEKGNEYGDKPVIAFWYETTNVAGGDITPMDFIMYFTAFQDNNPNAENELNVAGLPDDRFRDSQMETIKEGGTVENAMAYELDDDTTPVDLVASELFMDEIGRTTYDLD